MSLNGRFLDSVEKFVNSVFFQGSFSLVVQSESFNRFNSVLHIFESLRHFRLFTRLHIIISGSQYIRESSKGVTPIPVNQMFTILTSCYCVSLTEIQCVSISQFSFYESPLTGKKKQCQVLKSEKSVKSKYSLKRITIVKTPPKFLLETHERIYMMT